MVSVCAFSAIKAWFRSEATGAAQVVSGPFRGRSDQRAIQFEERRSAQRDPRASWRMAIASRQPMGWTPRTTFRFGFSPQHGSRAGLAVPKAGRLTQLLTPLNLADMLALTSVRHKVVVIFGLLFRSLYPSSREPQCAVNRPEPMLTIRRSAARTRPSGPISANCFFQRRTPAS